MAIYRPIRISYWQDGFVLDLTPEEKFFYLYLLTNSKTTQCGIYKLPMQVVQLETGYNKETVMKLISKFIEYKKIKYSEETGEVYILNWIKYNPVNNANIIKRVFSELSEVKSREFFDEFCKGLPRGLQGATKGLIRGYQAPTKEPTPTPTSTSSPTSTSEPTPTIADDADESESVDNSECENPEAEEEALVVPYKKIKEEWNRICTGYPQVTQITKKRKIHIKARWKQHGKDMTIFTNAFGKLQNSLFCKGENDRAWIASFDWLMGDDTNMVKVLEDKYKNKSIPVQQHRPNAFHNFKQDPLPYSEKELNEMLKKINGLQ